jgi:hypothetical protein
MASSLPEKSSDVAKDAAWTKQAFRKDGHNAFAVKDVKDRAVTKAAGVVAVAGNFGGGDQGGEPADQKKKKKIIENRIGLLFKTPPRLIFERLVCPFLGFCGNNELLF